MSSSSSPPDSTGTAGTSGFDGSHLLFSVGWNRPSLTAHQLPGLAMDLSMPLPGLSGGDDVTFVGENRLAVTSWSMGSPGNSSVFILDISAILPAPPVRGSGVPYSGLMRIVRVDKPHTHPIRRVRVLESAAARRMEDSSTGCVCVTVAGDKTIAGWGAANGKEVFRISGSSRSLYSFAELPWADSIGAAGGCSVAIYDIETQKLLSGPAKTFHGPTDVWAMEKSVEAKTVLSGDISKCLYVFDPRKDLVPVSATMFSDYVMCIRCVPERHLIAVRIGGGSVYILDDRKMPTGPSDCSIGNSGSVVHKLELVHGRGAASSCDMLQITEEVFASVAHGGNEGMALWTLGGKVLKTTSMTGEGLACNTEFCRDKFLWRVGVTDEDADERFVYVCRLMDDVAGGVTGCVRFTIGGSGSALIGFGSFLA